MPRRAINSSCRDPENRSKKFCACGGHQGKRGKKRRRRWSRENLLKQGL